MTEAIKERVSKLLSTGLRNYWYPALPSWRLQSAPLGITRLGENLVLWRDKDGGLHAIEDRCPHRGARLSLGWNLGDRVACWYHGIEVNGGGTVTSVPAVKACPLEGQQCLKHYPVQEQRGGIFVWFGDALHQEAPQLTLPEQLGSDEWASMLCTAMWECNYQYAVDNVMDPMHGAYLHARSHSMAMGDKQAEMRVKKTPNGIMFEKIGQREVNFDWVELADTGTLFLDHKLVIRRYTPPAAKVYRLIGSDVGRPLSDITSNLDGAHLANALQADLQTVLDTLIPVEREVRCTDGAWYLARIQPYRTLDNVIEGVVLTFTPVTEFKLASEAAQRASTELAATRMGATQLARDLAEGIVDTVVEPLLVLDGGLQVISASRSFYEHFQVTAGQTVGRKIYDLGNGQWDIPALRELLEDILPQNQVMDGYVVEHDFPGLGQRRMVLNARRIVTALGNTEMILLAMVAIEAKGTS